jgi:hypothetical protein
MLIPVALQLAVLASATIQPASVPGRGEQEAVLTLDRAGMVRLAATGRSGTACAVVDHLRGPFAFAGQVGVKDCETDLLLDAGTYKVRLTSPAKGKGTVALRATSFQELNAAPVRLEPGRAVEQPLRSGEQASFWVHLDTRGAVALRASGRTGGQVQLWRSGAWREAVPVHDAGPSPRPGQPIHEWWIEQTLEPGDYLFTVYGTGARRWTEGTESDELSVQLGFVAPSEHVASLTLPPWGMAALEVPGDPLTAILSAPGSTAGTRLAVTLSGAGGEQGSCTVDPRAVVPECVVTAWGTAPAGTTRVLLVRGAPGTQVELRWAPRGTSARLVDGEYRQNQLAVPVEDLPAGEYLLGLRDVAPDPDAAPLGCALVRELDKGRRATVAVDFPSVAPGRPLSRAFNTGGDETIWFEVEAPGAFHVTTDPKRRERCELYRIEDGGMSRVSRTSDDAVCDLRQPLGRGRYELRISGGGPGIDRIVVSADAGPPAGSPARTGCSIRARLAADERYLLLANRTGAASVRGLVARPLPLRLASPLPLELQAGETIRLPLTGSGPIRVRPVAGKPATCALQRGGAGAWRDGACWLTVRGADELALAAPAGGPISVWVDQPATPKPLPPLQAFSPTPTPIPALPAGTPAFFDLDRDETRAFTFQVVEAGLYHVRTEGLLSTECTLRTPTVPQLAQDAGGGRGRNCQVATYLDPGTYLVTAKALGQSRGRASLVLDHRPAAERGQLASDGELFFRSPAGEMARQRLGVTAAGSYDLSTTALGAALACRLEDADGWPLIPVPSPCAQRVTLKKGSYLWTQLPLTVESMRHTRLAPARPAVVLRGEKPHAIDLWTTYPVEQGKKGRDEFLFTLEADLEVFIQLGGGMQGRIYRQGETGALELVPPQETPQPQGSGTEDGGEEEGDAPPPTEEYEAEGGDGDGACEDCGDEYVEEAAPRPGPARRPAPAPLVPVEPDRPAGHAVTLAAGRYRLVTEHSRGDVGVSYAVRIAAQVMTPGMTRDLPVPGKVTLRVPRNGTLRLRTRGESDVRCRLFDRAGRLVAESAELGDDWNCGLAQPLAAGDYALVLESETQLAGTTRLTLAEPPTADAGPLENGRRYTAGDQVIVAALPAPAADVVEVTLTAGEPFSCAVEDDAGGLLLARTETRTCQALLHPLGRTYRLRLWSLERPVEITAAVRQRPVAALSGGKLSAATAAQAEIARAGRFRTGEGVRCAAASAAGALRDCAPEVSLEAGPTVFAAPADARLGLEELVAALGAPRAERMALGRQPFVQRQTSVERAVHLLEVRAAPGERAAPACELEGGASAPGAPAEAACFAASSPGTGSTVRLSALADPPVAVTVTRLAVPLPAASRLDAGRRMLTLAAPATRWVLPSGPSRLELLLPPAAWAVLLAGDRAVDLCPPSADLVRCALTARGGELLLYAPGERRAQVDLVALPAAARPLALGGAPIEARARPGSLFVRAPAADDARALEISGARRCAVRLSDGTRLLGCAGTLPARVSAEIQLEVDGPIRLVAHPADAGPAALFGRPLSASAPALQPGQAAALAGALVERSFTLREPQVVHLRADRGVCALAEGPALVAVDGLGEGCAIDRVLPAGAHRLAIRAFADEPLSGVVRLSAEPVEELAEGIGPDRWLGPDETRVFRFTTASRGRVGIGLQQEAEVMRCTILDAAQKPLATGCQALLELEQGTYLLAVRAPAGPRPVRFRPVLVGLAGAKAAVPDEYLQDLFQRIGVKP